MKNFEMPHAATEASDEETAEKKKDKENTTEEKIGKIDEIFDELLDEVKDAPEAQKEALKILVQQLRQIGEQLRQVRDLKHLHELKRLMMKNWRELEELADGNPDLLKNIQKWGKKFVDEKILFYDMINDVKDELIDKSQEVQTGWNDIQTNIGRAAGLIDNVHRFEADRAIRNWLHKLKIDIDAEKIKWGSGLEDFIASISSATNGFDEDDIDISSANDFLDNLNGLMRDLYRLAYKKGPLGQPSPIENNPELESILGGMNETSKNISLNIKEASKIYKVTKKIRDTHFLPLYNEQPEQIAA